AAPPIARASAARLLPIETEDGTHRDAENRAAELVIPGKEVAQSVRQAEDPLAHRHRRKDVVDQVCGVRRHAAAAAARTEAPSFAGERHEPLERAVVAPNPRKAARERAAGQELAELALDEPRQTVPVAVIVGLAEERFQILADDAMEDRALCVSGLIARGAHERRASEVRAVRPGRRKAWSDGPRPARAGIPPRAWPLPARLQPAGRLQPRAARHLRARAPESRDRVRAPRAPSAAAGGVRRRCPQLGPDPTPHDRRDAGG